ncbi:MAG: hypothetical protein JWM74_3646 [Myxococcaceae bacterium]|nr:hypothetical protein [Myxococcaceae bacterium]
MVHRRVPFAFALLALASAACSSSKATTTPSDGDASVSPDASAEADAGASLAACGTAPHVKVDITVVGASLSDTPPRVPGAVFASPMCPEITLTTDADGKIAGLIQKGLPFYGRFEAPGWANTMIPEQLFEADTPGLVVTLPPSLLGALIPGFGPDTSAIFVNGFKEGKGACAALDGISFTVTSHPEAKVIYFSTDSIPTPVDGATATTAGGRAAINGLTLAEGEIVVTVEGVKAGCAVSFKKDTSTGRLPLGKGAITIAGAYLRDL